MQDINSYTCETNRVSWGIWCCRYSVITIYYTCNVISRVASSVLYHQHFPQDVYSVLCWLQSEVPLLRAFLMCCCGFVEVISRFSSFPIITGIGFLISHALYFYCKVIIIIIF
jgi:hypothetical protein